MDRKTELKNLIIYHQNLYYNNDPEISDAEFDRLWDELKQIEPENDIFKTVGKDSSDGFVKTKHIMFMGSQQKASNEDEFITWFLKKYDDEYIIEYKLDGLSLELQYIKGLFIKGITRGDGIIGDDITNNVKKMKNFLPKINDDFTGSVRAEIVMEHDIFEKYYSGNANCRNMASGISKTKDGRGCEHLTIIYYDAVRIENDFKTEIAKIDWMIKQGFKIVTYSLFVDLGMITGYRQLMIEDRKKLNYDIDGLVIKSNIIDKEDMKRPRPDRQIAFKFPPDEAITTLKEVIWSESGANYTPIGVFEAVSIAGTNVQKASLCNVNLINELGIKIGSKITVVKRGDIIPKIENVIENPESATDIEIPTICETCQTELINEGTRLFCPNKYCMKKDFHRLKKWINTLEIREFGDALLTSLFRNGKISKIADLYNLRVYDLSSLERMGDRSANKVLTNLNNVKEVSLAKFVAGFNIEGIGKTLIETIVNETGIETLAELKNLSINRLENIEGIGYITGNQIINGLNELYQDMLAVLETGKIQIISTKKGNKLSGQSFCFTGTLYKMKRKEVEQLVKDNGGFIKSVGNGLSYLVTNDTTSGSSKNKKAKQLNIPIINEEQFFEMM